MMETGRTFALSILAGLIAGGIMAGINMVLVQPYTTLLADIELDNLLAEGAFDEEEFDAQIQSIYVSQNYISLTMGLAGGALVGGTFVISRIRMAPLKAGLLIAGIAWFVLYVIPAIKYPPSPEAMFNPELAGTYQLLFGAYAAVSGLAALAIALGSRRVERKEKVFGAAALYLVVVAGAFFVFPDYHSEDDTLLPQPIVNSWRSAISLSATAFWFALGTISGLFWASREMKAS